MLAKKAPREFLYHFGKKSYPLSARTHVMGVLNVTPDSFSDGGKFFDPGYAVEHALRMVEEGADFIDIGGESTRPKGRSYGEGAVVVDVEEECRRILPVIAGVAAQTDIPISVDTYKASVAREALQAGAVIVNDISGFHFDAEMPKVVAEAGASAVVMHIRGTPKTMQHNPSYADLFGEISSYLREGIEWGVRAGVQQLFVDPGIGFGKTLDHNLRILGGVDQFSDLGYPILLGPSRKSFLGAILDLPADDRLEGTLASITAAVLRGVHVVRVHDVKAVKRTVLVADAIRRASETISG
jgi:dihydropteroate synthase